MPNFDIVMKQLILILLVTLMSCKGNQNTAQSEQAQAMPLSGAYEVTDLVGSALGAKKPMINFETKESRVFGNSGCNSYFGQYEQDGKVLKFGVLGSTEMACQEPLMQAEIALYNAFQNTASFELENSILVLKDAQGNDLLTAIYKRD